MRNQKQGESIKITLDDFFSGIFASLRLADQRIVQWNQCFEESITLLFEKLMEWAEQEGIRVCFRIRLHPIYRDSTVIHRGIYAAIQRGIISLNIPQNTIIMIHLSQDGASLILNDIAGKDVIKQVVRLLN